MNTNSAVRAAAVVLLCACGQGAAAQTACLQGVVGPRDYAELSQRLSDSSWGSISGVALTSTLGNLRLKVVNPSGASVCQETANNATACTFTVGFASYGSFTIIVDNADMDAANAYRVCAQ